MGAFVIQHYSAKCQLVAITCWCKIKLYMASRFVSLHIFFSIFLVSGCKYLREIIIYNDYFDDCIYAPFLSLNE